MTLTEAKKILLSKTLSDWAMLQEAISSCAIEGIKSQELESAMRAWLKGKATNKQVLYLAERVK